MGVRRISRELEGDFTLSPKIGFKFWQLIPSLQEFGCAIQVRNIILKINLNFSKENL